MCVEHYTVSILPSNNGGIARIRIYMRPGEKYSIAHSTHRSFASGCCLHGVFAKTEREALKLAESEHNKKCRGIKVEEKSTFDYLKDYRPFRR